GSLAGQWWSIPYLRLRLYSKKSSRAASQAMWSHSSPASSPVGTEVMTGPKKPRPPLIESIGHLAVLNEHGIALGAHAKTATAQILLQTNGASELAQPIREHADLTRGLALTRPRC